MSDTEAASADPTAAPLLPDGDYAIVEILGHRTIIGMVTEVERFGTKLMSIEPLFRSQLLPAVLIGGGSIYQFTPCSKEVALQRQPKNEYSLPTSIAAALPPELLPPPRAEAAFLHTSVGDDDDDGLPF